MRITIHHFTITRTILDRNEGHENDRSYRA